MRKIIVLAAILVGLSAQSQDFESKVMQYSLINAKAYTRIKIMDSIVEIYSKGYNSQKFEVVKKTMNGVIYVTDGVKTNVIYVAKNKGKVKGYKYNYLIKFNFEGVSNSGAILYYSNLYETDKMRNPKFRK